MNEAQLLKEAQEKAKQNFYNALWKLLNAVLEWVGITFGSALILMLLWNWLMPELFKLPAITYWQSLGLHVLCNLLFKDGLALHYVCKTIKAQK